MPVLATTPAARTLPDVLAAVDLGSNSFHMVVARYSHGLIILGRVVRLEREPLTGVLLAFSIALFLAATLAHVLERDAQPDAFGSVPKALSAICMKAMAFHKEDRYATPQALVKDIEHSLAGEPTSAYREPILARVARWVRRHRRGLLRAAGLAFVALLAVWGILGRVRPVAFGQGDQVRAVEIDAKILKEIRVLPAVPPAGAEPDLPVILVDPVDPADDPVALGDLVLDATLRAVHQVQVPPAVLLRHVDDLVRLGQVVDRRILGAVREDVLDVGESSLYPALHRLERQGWIKAEWSESENNRKAKYYSLTAAGRKQLKAEV